MRVISVLLVVTACASAGTKLKKSEVDKVVVGQTTWAEAEKKFGMPNNIMDKNNSVAAGYFAKECGPENDPIRVAQYVYMDQSESASTEFLIDQRGVICGIKRANGQH